MSWSKLFIFRSPLVCVAPKIRVNYLLPSAKMSNNSNYLPENMQEIKDSYQAQAINDRSREVSGQQTMNMFSGSFMSSQNANSESSDSCGIDQSVRGSEQCHDLNGNAHMSSVFQINVPEPFKAENEEFLKEGIPEGLSDCVQDQDLRWSMEDRIDHSKQIFTE